MHLSKTFMNITRQKMETCKGHLILFMYINVSTVKVNVLCVADADRKEEWWPKSPNGEEMCKTQ